MDSIRNKAMVDLLEAIASTEGTSTRFHYQICRFMQARNWHVKPNNLLDTARTLGFLVIGSEIYPSDAMMTHPAVMERQVTVQ